MQNKRIYLCLAHMSENGMEQKYIKEAFDTNWVVPLGPNVNGFEKDLEEFLILQGRDEGKLVVALSSGTAAIHLALVDLGVSAGDEVICQSFTFSASANPICYMGATPVFVDSETDTWNMDPVLLRKAIEDRIKKTGRKPKAIILVYLYGMPAKIEEIVEIASEYDIPLIEDAAEAMGSRYKGQMVGTFGKYGILSFNGNKMITTSGGGALICENDEVKKRIMFYATQAREAFPYYQHEHVGYNYRLSNICAGIGRGQMTIIDDHLAHHRHVHKLYQQLLADVKGVTVLDNLDANIDSNFWLTTIVLNEDLCVIGQDKAYSTAVQQAVGGAAGVVHATGAVHTAVEPNANVEAMRVALDAAGVEARPLWKPMHLQPVFAPCPAYINGNSEQLFRQGLCLPSGPCVTDEDVRFVVEQIRNNCKYNFNA